MVSRATQIARGLPRLAGEFRSHVAASCEVARLLSDRLGLPVSTQRLFGYIDERWDGKGTPGRASGEAIPMPVRIAQVARDAAFQRMLGGTGRAAGVIGDRSGGAFDPSIARLLAEEAGEILALDAGISVWEPTVAAEPAPMLTLNGQAVDRALEAMGDFADLASSYLVGHSVGVSRLAGLAAQCAHLPDSDVQSIRRARAGARCGPGRHRDTYLERAASARGR